MSPHSAQALAGLAAFAAIAWVVSERRWHIRVRPLIGSALLALAFTWFVTSTPPGRALFETLSKGVDVILTASKSAGEQVFGPLAKEFSFALHVLPMIVVVSALISVLYHFRILQFCVWATGQVTRRIMGLSGAEANVAAAETVFGPQESQALVAKYIPVMTRSELLAMMAGGLATVAGGVMMAFVGMLRSDVPNIASHLIAASVLNSILVFFFTKIVIPEDRPRDDGELSWKVETPNLFGALIEGGLTGGVLIYRIGIGLLVFYAVVFIADKAYNSVAIAAGIGTELDTLPEVVGWGFRPFGWLMGIPNEDLPLAGELLAKRLFLSEFVAYNDMSILLREHPDALSERTKLVMSYALCGFANFVSVGVMISSIGGLAPSRAEEVARLGWKALLCATLTTFASANIASLVVFGF